MRAHSGSDGRVHAVMVVANDVSTDSRVRKEALALADGGARVTVLGIAPDGQRSVEPLGSATIMRVPMPYVVRDEHRRVRGARRAWRPPVLRHRVVDRGFRLGWRAWDVGVSRITWPADWRRVHPEAHDYEAAFGPVIDELAPDVLHAHDMHVIGVAARAARRAEHAGRALPVVYDAHEYVPGLSRYGPRTPRFIAAWARHEREFIGAADRVITVSPAIATTLQRRYSLPAEPTVIINTPSAEEVEPAGTDLRGRIGLRADVPLLVYSGGVTKARGVETAVQALAQLPDAHLAVVAVPHVAIAPVEELRRLAARMGVTDRVHFLDPVPSDQVVSFLSTADLGVIPILRYPSHEMALPNKVFEYVFAGLPVVVSNMPSLTDFVRRWGIGEVFDVEDVADLATKVDVVLSDRERYLERVRHAGFRAEMSWESQAARLRDLYVDLLRRPLSA